ncbi:hypothetical protein [Marinithermus hydrothermalis]|uniref:Peptidase M50 n=1 Tax=Marinithermus hydrothermalis (strain DSM 14884 / JCM 11576 / T1) TaxID=869210 RepID=F2NQA3_MARHT|nr:hypothetical protein [Marinithermus hydrothermalis]AEB11414.1 hypothetical protein Marky_0664 [Marinithermus hydrothermalis DSM 14884]
MPRWAVACLVVIPALGNPLHELGHWIGYALAGIPAAFSFNRVLPLAPEGAGLAGVAGGPLASLALAGLGVVVLYRVPRRALVGASLAAVMAYTRLLPYLLFVLGIVSPAQNDEGMIARALGWPLWSVWLPFALAFLGILALAWRGLKVPTAQRLGWFALLFVAYAAAAAVEVLVLDPVWFPGVGGFAR